VTADALLQSDIQALQLFNRGKVRDIYDVDDDHLLIVATDRISAFDVVLPTPIPGKGAVLTALSEFWFAKTRDLVPNHLDLGTRTVASVLAGVAERDVLASRSMVVRKLKPLPVEAIVRGYVIGSGWKDYQRTGAICGITLPAELRLAEQLDTAIYTPSSKADVGEHDENISFADTEALLGPELAASVRDTALALYTRAREHAAACGIIIADTKFEFGTNSDGDLVLIDEILTPDSSRFWPADRWQPGQNPPSFDKQFVRDYLETLDWDKQSPAPALPDDIQQQTADKYQRALHLLTT